MGWSRGYIMFNSHKQIIHTLNQNKTDTHINISESKSFTYQNTNSCSTGQNISFNKDASNEKQSFIAYVESCIINYIDRQKSKNKIPLNLSFYEKCKNIKKADTEIIIKINDILRKAEQDCLMPAIALVYQIFDYLDKSEGLFINSFIEYLKNEIDKCNALYQEFYRIEKLEEFIKSTVGTASLAQRIELAYRRGNLGENSSNIDCYLAWKKEFTLFNKLANDNELDENFYKPIQYRPASSSI
jgi:hypothetical protein